ncbi:MAG TPA: hypothetical protein VLV45_14515 [Gemmatimonadales bacterium]|nr:hypothetical protein [Gemmatimonadales bacterium]
MTRGVALFVALADFAARATSAQRAVEATLSAQAIVIATHADPIPDGGTLTEVRVVQPVVMLDGAWRDYLLLHTTVDFEGKTIPNGELATGNWGEGFIDRRHPHTYFHEVMLSSPDVLRSWTRLARVTISAGKGFVPFGTDDPMSRPAERYPVNHHLSQILERGVAMIAIERGMVTGEASLFNGDEPQNPGQSPNWSRFGDSWSARLMLRPVKGMETGVSRASVASPEDRGGAGPTADKWSVSARFAGSWARTPVYGMAEWARTSESAGALVYYTVLVEGAVTVGRHQPYYRFERTDRPEDIRTFDDPFRTVRPHLDNSVLGITRWSVHTIGYAILVTPRTARFEARPLVEFSGGSIKTISGLFDPVAVYGRDTFWTLSVGLRLGWGMTGHRMGHYGVPMKTAMPMEM